MYLKYLMLFFYIMFYDAMLSLVRQNNRLVIVSRNVKLYVCFHVLS